MISTLLSLIFVAATAHAAGGQELGNGAGGVKVDGETMTFETAKVPVGQPLRPEEIPGLTQLGVEIYYMPLTPELKMQMLSWIYPAGTQRAYYRIAENRLDAEGRKKLIQDYARLMNVPEDQVVLFALTNSQGETFLLPEFFNLKLPQQMAILLHEGLWRYDMTLSYKDVVRTEMAAQAYFQNHDDKNAYFHFFNQLTDVLSQKRPQPEILLRAALSYDQVRPPVSDTPYMLLWKLFGIEFPSCYRKQVWQQQMGTGASCTDDLLLSLQGSFNSIRQNMFADAMITILNKDLQRYYFCFIRNDRKSNDFASNDAFSEWLYHSSFVGAGVKTLHEGNHVEERVPLTPAEQTATHIIATMIDPYGVFWGNLALCERNTAGYFFRPGSTMRAVRR